MDSKSQLVGTGFLDSVVATETPSVNRINYEQVHGFIVDYTHSLADHVEFEAIRRATLELLNRVTPCEQIHVFFAPSESEEAEVLEAFRNHGVRVKNRFASDQLLLLSLKGGDGLASAVIRLVNKLDWTAFTDADARMLESIAAPLALRLETLRLQRGLKSQLQSSILALASAIEVKDRYTGGHTRRVLEYADAIASQLPIPEEECEKIRLAGLLHDIGKIGVPDRILHKPASLTEAEWTEMRQHTESGYEIVSRVSGLEEIAEILRHHHERWDGAGYPRGLMGDEIPRASRIIAVADTYDAMVTDRPYRQAMHPDEARDLIVGLAGTQFDPWVVEGFVRAYKRWSPPFGPVS